MQSIGCRGAGGRFGKHSRLAAPSPCVCLQVVLPPPPARSHAVLGSALVREVALRPLKGRKGPKGPKGRKGQVRSLLPHTPPRGPRAPRGSSRPLGPLIPPDLVGQAPPYDRVVLCASPAPRHCEERAKAWSADGARTAAGMLPTGIGAPSESDAAIPKNLGRQPHPPCHSERSEESRKRSARDLGILRFAQNDTGEAEYVRSRTQGWQSY
jgi:hypothetical protein